MPRTARRLSETQMYHVMLRGNEQRQIFQDEEDNLKFISVLKDIKKISEFQLFAYCLMGNHVHLLMGTGGNGESLGPIFRRFGAKYVYWYNLKYGRVGHLFQDRFRSETVEDDAHMLAVMRYIHRNPLNADMTERIEDYPYSSYNEYLVFKPGQLTDTDFILSSMGYDSFIEFHKEWDDRKYLEINDARPRISDQQARALIHQMVDCSTIEEFQSLSNAKKTEAIKGLIAANAGYRQISRLTGENFYLVRKIGQSLKGE